MAQERGAYGTMKDDGHFARQIMSFWRTYYILGDLLLSGDHTSKRKATVLDSQVFAQMIVSVVVSVSHGLSDSFSSTQACPAKSPRTATCPKIECPKIPVVYQVSSICQ
jgi:hypothetical protein